MSNYNFVIFYLKNYLSGYKPYTTKIRIISVAILHKSSEGVLQVLLHISYKLFNLFAINLAILVEKKLLKERNKL